MLFTHHPSLAPYPAGLAPDSVSFRNPSGPFPLLQQLSHPPEATSIHSAGGVTVQGAHVIANHHRLIVMYLGCCLQGRPQCLHSSFLLLNFARDPWGRAEASGLALLSVVIVQLRLERSGLWGFLHEVRNDCQLQLEASLLLSLTSS